jgi:hypothetical protein
MLAAIPLPHSCGSTRSCRKPWFAALLAANLNLDRFGLGSGRLASLMFNTPLALSALTRPGSAELGRLNERVKPPYCRARQKFSFFSFSSILRSPWTVGVLFSMRTSISFSSMPGTSIFRVSVCSSS